MPCPRKSINKGTVEMTPAADSHTQNITLFIQQVSINICYVPDTVLDTRMTMESENKYRLHVVGKTG